MRHIIKNDDGTMTIILHLNKEERSMLKRLGKTLEMNDFDVLKYAMKLVFWWSKGRIEPEEEE